MTIAQDIMKVLFSLINPRFDAEVAGKLLNGIYN
jgi:hypothetical protein